MTTLFSIMMVVHVLVSIAICALVLLQRGKGADAGAAFGAGASGTVFGARGAANFLSRATAVLATLFFVNSLALAYLTTQNRAPESIVDTAPSSEAAADAEDQPVVEPVDPDAVPSLSEPVPADEDVPLLEENSAEIDPSLNQAGAEDGDPQNDETPPVD